MPDRTSQDSLKPHAYVELHIEQGPVLDRERVAIGAVENLQGISWQRVMIEGAANHAGTTPMAMRRDAGLAAARAVTFLGDRARASNTPTVATVGCITFEPNAINVIPSRAAFTVDLRDPDEGRLREEEAALAGFLDDLAHKHGVVVIAEPLARFEPVTFDQALVRLIEFFGAFARPHGAADDLRRGPRRADDGADLPGGHDLRAEPGGRQSQPGGAYR